MSSSYSVESIGNEIVYENTKKIYSFRLCTHQKICDGLLAEIVEGFAEVDEEGVVGPERGLDDGPVGHPPVPGY